MYSQYDAKYKYQNAKYLVVTEVLIGCSNFNHHYLHQVMFFSEETQRKKNLKLNRCVEI